MTTTIKPRNDDQVREAVAWALSSAEPLELVGAGTKRGFGRPVQAGHVLDLSDLAGITLYEPEELVLGARAGTTMAEIEAALTAKRQMLAFEPPDLGLLYGGAAGQATLGGVLACNLAGPRRIKAGAARDHFLGFHGVSGRGEAFKAGGRVVKNVTGYDVAKLMAGSFGTLAALTEVTVKVLPAPEKTRTVLLFGLADNAAIEALTLALQSAHDVSGAAHLPAGIADLSSVGRVAEAGGAVTAIRLEGTPDSVAYRCAALRQELSGLAAAQDELHSMNSGQLWRELRDAAYFAGDQQAVIWRISVPPAAGAKVAAALADAGLPFLHFYDWGGGLIWLATLPEDDAGAKTIRGAIAEIGGHATLLRGPAPLRVAVPPFQPQPPDLAALSRRIKEAFDPEGILNPGRMESGG
jgi:glycolate oxidase FAD binding subunit